jgi:type IV secretory pathway VirB4 component
VSAEIIRTLITAGAALLGALIGFGASFLASSRAIKDARKQTRYSHVHEQRSETLRTIYGMFFVVRREYRTLMLYLSYPEPLQEMPPEKANEKIKEQRRKVATKVHELLLYRVTNSFFIPKNIRSELTPVYVALEKFLNEMDEEWEAQPELKRRAPEKSLKEARAWFDNEFKKHMEALRSKINRVLGVDEEPIPDLDKELDEKPMIRLGNQVR